MTESDRFLKTYDEYADAIYRHCYFRVYDEERARDLMQETFMRTWQYIADGKEIQNMRAFLYRVANNLVIDEFRKKKELSLDELAESGFDPGVDEKEKIHASVEANQILLLLDKLDEKHREVLILRYVEDLSFKDIAKVLGETENAITVRAHRALKKVKELINHV